KAGRILERDQTPAAQRLTICQSMRPRCDLKRGGAAKILNVIVSFMRLSVTRYLVQNQKASPRHLARLAFCGVKGTSLCKNASPVLIPAIRFWCDLREDRMRRFVEGVDRGQTTLFPECLEDWIGEDDPVRVVDVFVEELDLAELGFGGVD